MFPASPGAGVRGGGECYILIVDVIDQVSGGILVFFPPPTIAPHLLPLPCRHMFFSAGNMVVKTTDVKLSTKCNSQHRGTQPRVEPGLHR